MRQSGWILAALAIGIGFGVIVGFENTALMLALFVLVVVVIGVVVLVGLTSRAPAKKELVFAGGGVEIVRSEEDDGPESSDPLRRALGIGTVATMLIVAADAEGYTLGRPSGIRYLLLGVPLLALLLGAAVSTRRGRLAKTTVADRYLFVYAFCGVIGSIYGRALLHTPDSGTVIFLPMSLGLAHLMIRDPMTASEAKRFQAWLVRVSVVFLTFGIVSQTPLWPLATPGRNSFERTFFVAWGLSAALLSRKRGATMLILGLSAIMFLQYPAATWMIVLMCSLATAYATSRLGRRTGTLVLLAFAVGVLGVGFLQVSGGGKSSIATSYFSAVGKTNNTRSRTQLAQAAEIEIRKSPWIGSLWTKNFTVENRNRAITIYGVSARIEPHNDYLEAVVLGGFLALFMFGGLIISTNLVVIRRVHALDDIGATTKRDLLRVCLIGFNAAFAAAAFNPELSKPGSTAVIFLVYAMMMTIRPAPPAATEPATRRRFTAVSPADDAPPLAT